MRETKYHVSAFKFITYCLVTNKKQLHRVCKEKGIPKHDIPVRETGARVNFIYFEVGALAIVQMPESDHTLPDKLGLLAHECVHIKQQVMDEIGEKFPSDEFEAYFIQELVTNLTDDYLNIQA